jgi:glycosyltransferase involved in cell wall biosynthesis
MRIALMIGSMREGGAEGQLVLLAKELRQRGHDVAIMLLHPEGARLAELIAEGFLVFPVALPRFRPRWSPIPWLLLPVAWWRTGTFLRQWRPDVLHAWLFWAHLWAWLTLPLAGRRPRFITSRLGTPTRDTKGRRQAAIESRINRRADAVWANSAGVARDVASIERNLPPPQVIRNGLPIDRLLAAPAADLRALFPDLADARLIVIHVASLIPVKAHDVLLEAWALVLREAPDVKVLCVGADGGLRTQLEQHRDRLGLTRHVVFAGPRPDVPSLIKGADIGVLCSHREGLSNAMLEYMILGKAVVCTDVNGAREAITPETDGLIVPPADPQALAAAIIRLAHDPALRNQLGTNATTTQDRFGLPAMVDAMLAIYAPPA